MTMILVTPPATPPRNHFSRMPIPKKVVAAAAAGTTTRAIVVVPETTTIWYSSTTSTLIFTLLLLLLLLLLSLSSSTFMGQDFLNVVVIMNNKNNDNHNNNKNTIINEFNNFHYYDVKACCGGRSWRSGGWSVVDSLVVMAEASSTNASNTTTPLIPTKTLATTPSDEQTRSRDNMSSTESRDRTSTPTGPSTPSQPQTPTQTAPATPTPSVPSTPSQERTSTDTHPHTSSEPHTPSASHPPTPSQTIAPTPTDATPTPSNTTPQTPTATIPATSTATHKQTATHTDTEKATLSENITSTNSIPISGTSTLAASQSITNPTPTNPTDTPTISKLTPTSSATPSAATPTNTEGMTRTNEITSSETLYQQYVIGQMSLSVLPPNPSPTSAFGGDDVTQSSIQDRLQAQLLTPILPPPSSDLQQQCGGNINTTTMMMPSSLVPLSPYPLYTSSSSSSSSGAASRLRGLVVGFPPPMVTWDALSLLTKLEKNNNNNNDDGSSSSGLTKLDATRIAAWNTYLAAHDGVVVSSISGQHPLRWGKSLSYNNNKVVMMAASSFSASSILPMMTTDALLPPSPTSTSTSTIYNDGDGSFLASGLVCEEVAVLYGLPFTSLGSNNFTTTFPDEGRNVITTTTTTALSSSSSNSSSTSVVVVNFSIIGWVNMSETTTCQQPQHPQQQQQLGTHTHHIVATAQVNVSEPSSSSSQHVYVTWYGVQKSSSTSKTFSPPTNSKLFQNTSEVEGYVGTLKKSELLRRAGGVQLIDSDDEIKRMYSLSSSSSELTTDDDSSLLETSLYALATSTSSSFALPPSLKFAITVTSLSSSDTNSSSTTASSSSSTTTLAAPFYPILQTHKQLLQHGGDVDIMMPINTAVDYEYRTHSTNRLQDYIISTAKKRSGSSSSESSSSTLSAAPVEVVHWCSVELEGVTWYNTLDQQFDDDCSEIGEGDVDATTNAMVSSQVSGDASRIASMLLTATSNNNSDDMSGVLGTVLPIPQLGLTSVGRDHLLPAFRSWIKESSMSSPSSSSSSSPFLAALISIRLHNALIETLAALWNINTTTTTPQQQLQLLGNLSYLLSLDPTATADTTTTTTSSTLRNRVRLPFGLEVMYVPLPSASTSSSSTATAFDDVAASRLVFYYSGDLSMSTSTTSSSSAGPTIWRQEEDTSYPSPIRLEVLTRLQQQRRQSCVSNNKKNRVRVDGRLVKTVLPTDLIYGVGGGGNNHKYYGSMSSTGGGTCDYSQVVINLKKQLSLPPSSPTPPSAQDAVEADELFTLTSQLLAFLQPSSAAPPATTDSSVSAAASSRWGTSSRIIRSLFGKMMWSKDMIQVIKMACAHSSSTSSSQTPIGSLCGDMSALSTTSISALSTASQMAAVRLLESLLLPTSYDDDSSSRTTQLADDNAVAFIYNATALFNLSSSSTSNNSRSGGASSSSTSWQSSLLRPVHTMDVKLRTCFNGPSGIAAATSDMFGMKTLFPGTNLTDISPSDLTSSSSGPCQVVVLRLDLSDSVYQTAQATTTTSASTSSSSQATTGADIVLVPLTQGVVASISSSSSPAEAMIASSSQPQTTLLTVDNSTSSFTDVVMSYTHPSSGSGGSLNGIDLSSALRQTAPNATAVFIDSIVDAIISSLSSSASTSCDSNNTSSSSVSRDVLKKVFGGNVNNTSSSLSESMLYTHRYCVYGPRTNRQVTPAVLVVTGRGGGSTGDGDESARCWIPSSAATTITSSSSRGDTIGLLTFQVPFLQQDVNSNLFNMGGSTTTSSLSSMRASMLDQVTTVTMRRLLSNFSSSADIVDIVAADDGDNEVNTMMYGHIVSLLGNGTSTTTTPSDTPPSSQLLQLRSRISSLIDTTILTTTWIERSVAVGSNINGGPTTTTTTIATSSQLQLQSRFNKWVDATIVSVFDTAMMASTTSTHTSDTNTTTLTLLAASSLFRDVIVPYLGSACVTSQLQMATTTSTALDAILAPCLSSSYPPPLSSATLPSSSSILNNTSSTTTTATTTLSDMVTAIAGAVVKNVMDTMNISITTSSTSSSSANTLISKDVLDSAYTDVVWLCKEHLGTSSLVPTQDGDTDTITTTTTPGTTTILSGYPFPSLAYYHQPAIIVTIGEYNPLHTTIQVVTLATNSYGDVYEVRTCTTSTYSGDDVGLITISGDYNNVLFPSTSSMMGSSSSGQQQQQWQALQLRFFDDGYNAVGGPSSSSTSPTTTATKQQELLGNYTAAVSKFINASSSSDGADNVEVDQALSAAVRATLSLLKWELGKYLHADFIDTYMVPSHPVVLRNSNTSNNTTTTSELYRMVRDHIINASSSGDGSNNSSSTTTPLLLESILMPFSIYSHDQAGHRVSLSNMAIRGLPINTIRRVAASTLSSSSSSTLPSEVDDEEEIRYYHCSPNIIRGDVLATTQVSASTSAATTKFMLSTQMGFVAASGGGSLASTTTTATTMLNYTMSTVAISTANDLNQEEDPLPPVSPFAGATRDINQDDATTRISSPSSSTTPSFVVSQDASRRFYTSPTTGSLLPFTHDAGGGSNNNIVPPPSASTIFTISSDQNPDDEVVGVNLVCIRIVPGVVPAQIRIGNAIESNLRLQGQHGGSLSQHQSLPTSSSFPPPPPPSHLSGGPLPSFPPIVTSSDDFGVLRSSLVLRVFDWSGLEVIDTAPMIDREDQRNDYFSYTGPYTSSTSFSDLDYSQFCGGESNTKIPNSTATTSLCDAILQTRGDADHRILMKHDALHGMVIEITPVEVLSDSCHEGLSTSSSSSSSPSYFSLDMAPSTSTSLSTTTTKNTFNVSLRTQASTTWDSVAVASNAMMTMMKKQQSQSTTSTSSSSGNVTVCSAGGNTFAASSSITSTSSSILAVRSSTVVGSFPLVLPPAIHGLRMPLPTCQSDADYYTTWTTSTSPSTTTLPTKMIPPSQGSNIGGVFTLAVRARLDTIRLLSSSTKSLSSTGSTSSAGGAATPPPSRVYYITTTTTTAQSPSSSTSILNKTTARSVVNVNFLQLQPPPSSGKSRMVGGGMLNVVSCGALSVDGTGSDGSSNNTSSSSSPSSYSMMDDVLWASRIYNSSSSVTESPTTTTTSTSLSSPQCTSNLVLMPPRSISIQGGGGGQYSTFSTSYVSTSSTTRWQQSLSSSDSSGGSSYYRPLVEVMNNDDNDGAAMPSSINLLLSASCRGGVQDVAFGSIHQEQQQQSSSSSLDGVTIDSSSDVGLYVPMYATDAVTNTLSLQQLNSSSSSSSSSTETTSNSVGVGGGGCGFPWSPQCAIQVDDCSSYLEGLTTTTDITSSSAISTASNGVSVPANVLRVSPSTTTTTSSSSSTTTTTSSVYFTTISGTFMGVITEEVMSVVAMLHQNDSTACESAIESILATTTTSSSLVSNTLTTYLAQSLYSSLHWELQQRDVHPITEDENTHAMSILSTIYRSTASSTINNETMTLLWDALSAVDVAFSQFTGSGSSSSTGGGGALSESSSVVFYTIFTPQPDNNAYYGSAGAAVDDCAPLPNPAFFAAQQLYRATTTQGSSNTTTSSSIKSLRLGSNYTSALIDRFPQIQPYLPSTTTNTNTFNAGNTPTETAITVIGYGFDDQSYLSSSSSLSGSGGRYHHSGHYCYYSNATNYQLLASTTTTSTPSDIDPLVQASVPATVISRCRLRCTLPPQQYPIVAVPPTSSSTSSSSSSAASTSSGITKEIWNYDASGNKVSTGEGGPFFINTNISSAGKLWVPTTTTSNGSSSSSATTQQSLPLLPNTPFDPFSRLQMDDVDTTGNGNSVVGGLPYLPFAEIGDSVWSIFSNSRTQPVGSWETVKGYREARISAPPGLLRILKVSQQQTQQEEGRSENTQLLQLTSVTAPIAVSAIGPARDFLARWYTPSSTSSSAYLPYEHSTDGTATMTGSSIGERVTILPETDEFIPFSTITPAGNGRVVDVGNADVSSSNGVSGGKAIASTTARVNKLQRTTLPIVTVSFIDALGQSVVVLDPHLRNRVTLSSPLRAQLLLNGTTAVKQSFSTCRPLLMVRDLSVTRPATWAEIVEAATPPPTSSSTPLSPYATTSTGVVILRKQARELMRVSTGFAFIKNLFVLLPDPGVFSIDISIRKSEAPTSSSSMLNGFTNPPQFNADTFVDFPTQHLLLSVNPAEFVLNHTVLLLPPFPLSYTTAAFDTLSRGRFPVTPVVGLIGKGKANTANATPTSLYQQIDANVSDVVLLATVSRLDFNLTSNTWVRNHTVLSGEQGTELGALLPNDNSSSSTNSSSGSSGSGDDIPSGEEACSASWGNCAVVLEGIASFDSLRFVGIPGRRYEVTIYIVSDASEGDDTSNSSSTPVTNNDRLQAAATFQVRVPLCPFFTASNGISANPNTAVFRNGDPTLNESSSSSSTSSAFPVQSVLLGPGNISISDLDDAFTEPFGGGGGGGSSSSSVVLSPQERFQRDVFLEDSMELLAWEAYLFSTTTSSDSSSSSSSSSDIEGQRLFTRLTQLGAISPPTDADDLLQSRTPSNPSDAFTLRKDRRGGAIVKGWGFTPTVGQTADPAALASIAARHVNKNGVAEKDLLGGYRCRYSAMLSPSFLGSYNSPRTSSTSSGIITGEEEWRSTFPARFIDMCTVRCFVSDATVGSLASSGGGGVGESSSSGASPSSLSSSSSSSSISTTTLASSIGVNTCINPSSSSSSSAQSSKFNAYGQMLPCCYNGTNMVCPTGLAFAPIAVEYVSSNVTSSEDLLIFGRVKSFVTGGASTTSSSGDMPLGADTPNFLSLVGGGATSGTTTTSSSSVLAMAAAITAAGTPSAPLMYYSSNFSVVGRPRGIRVRAVDYASGAWGSDTALVVQNISNPDNSQVRTFQIQALVEVLSSQTTNILLPIFDSFDNIQSNNAVNTTNISGVVNLRSTFYNPHQIMTSNSQSMSPYEAAVSGVIPTKMISSTKTSSSSQNSKSHVKLQRPFQLSWSPLAPTAVVIVDQYEQDLGIPFNASASSSSAVGSGGVRRKIPVYVRGIRLVQESELLVPRPRTDIMTSFEATLAAAQQDAVATALNMGRRAVRWRHQGSHSLPSPFTSLTSPDKFWSQLLDNNNTSTPPSYGQYALSDYDSSEVLLTDIPAPQDASCFPILSPPMLSNIGSLLRGTNSTDTITDAALRGSSVVPIEANGTLPAGGIPFPFLVDPNQRTTWMNKTSTTSSSSSSSNILFQSTPIVALNADMFDRAYKYVVDPHLHMETSTTPSSSSTSTTSTTILSSLEFVGGTSPSAGYVEDGVFYLRGLALLSPAAGRYEIEVVACFDSVSSVDDSNGLTVEECMSRTQLQQTPSASTTPTSSSSPSNTNNNNTTTTPPTYFYPAIALDKALTLTTISPVHVLAGRPESTCLFTDFYGVTFKDLKEIQPQPRLLLKDSSGNAYQPSRRDPRLTTTQFQYLSFDVFASANLRAHIGYQYRAYDFRLDPSSDSSSSPSSSDNSTSTSTNSSWYCVDSGGNTTTSNTSTYIIIVSATTPTIPTTGNAWCVPVDSRFPVLDTDAIGVPTGVIDGSAPQSIQNQYNWVDSDRATIAAMMGGEAVLDAGSVAEYVEESGVGLLQVQFRDVSPGGIYSQQYRFSFSLSDSSVPSSSSSSPVIASLPIHITFCALSEYAVPFSSTCERCPSGSDRCHGGLLSDCFQCNGTTALLVAAGYWRYADYSIDAYSCPSSSCDGPASTSLCKDGYVQGSPLCDTCSDGFAKDLLDTCVKCPEAWVSVVLMVLISTLVVVVLTAFIFLSLKEIDEEELDDTLVITMKIFVNFMQVSSMLGEFKVNFPAFVLSYFEVVSSSSGSVGISISPVNCLFPSLTFTEKMDVQLLLPGAMLLGFGILLRVLHIRRLRNRERALRPELTDDLVASPRTGRVLDNEVLQDERKRLHQERPLLQVFGNASMILLFLMYQGNVTQCIRAFSCQVLVLSELPGDELQVLSHDSRVECSGLYYESQLAAAFYGLCGYGFLIPMGAMLFVLRVARREGWSAANMQFSFLVRGFRLRFWYWELVIVFRKIVVRMLLAVVEDPVLQALLGIWFLTALFVVQTFAKPYVRSIHNYAEQLSLMTTLVTLNIGLAFRTQETTTGERCGTVCQGFSIMLVAINVMTAAAFLAQIGLGVHDELVERFGIDTGAGDRWISIRNLLNLIFKTLKKEDRRAPSFTRYTPKILDTDLAIGVFGSIPYGPGSRRFVAAKKRRVTKKRRGGRRHRGADGEEHIDDDEEMYSNNNSGSGSGEEYSTDEDMSDEELYMIQEHDDEEDDVELGLGLGFEDCVVRDETTGRVDFEATKQRKFIRKMILDGMEVNEVTGTARLGDFNTTTRNQGGGGANGGGGVGAAAAALHHDDDFDMLHDYTDVNNNNQSMLNLTHRNNHNHNPISASSAGGGSASFASAGMLRTAIGTSPTFAIKNGSFASNSSLVPLQKPPSRRHNKHRGGDDNNSNNPTIIGASAAAASVGRPASSSIATHSSGSANPVTTNNNNTPRSSPADMFSRHLQSVDRGNNDVVGHDEELEEFMMIPPHMGERKPTLAPTTTDTDTTTPSPKTSSSSPSKKKKDKKSKSSSSQHQQQQHPPPTTTTTSAADDFDYFDQNATL